MPEKQGLGYTQELKESVVQRMMPPHNEAVGQLSEETGITTKTLYRWRQEARANGHAAPGDGQVSQQWNSEDKLLIVMETFSMNGAELAAYCRRKGLYPEQITQWKSACLQANAQELPQTKQLHQEVREEK